MANAASRDLATALLRSGMVKGLPANRVGLAEAGVAVDVGVEVLFPGREQIRAHGLAHAAQRRLRPAIATAREHLCDELSPEGEVTGLVPVVHAIDRAGQRDEAIVAGHPGVVDVDDFLEDEDLHEKEEVLFAIGVLARKSSTSTTP